MIKLFYIIIFFLSLNFSSFAQNSQISVIATVDNQIITNLDLNRRYSFFVKTSRIKISSKAEKNFILQQLTHKLIEEKLQFIEAKNLKIELSNAELQKALEEIASLQSKSDSQIKQEFKRKKIPYQEYQNQIKSQLLWKKIVNKTIAPTIKITDLEIAEMLELKKIDDKKISLNLAEIFIPFKNKTEEENSEKLAQKLVEEIKEGNNFKNIARQFSQSASSEFDGQIGWVDLLSIDSKIQKEIKNLKINEISKEIKLQDGYYIFKIIDKKTSSILEEEDIKQLKSIIFNKKLKNAAKSHLNSLKKKSYIRVIN